MRFRHAPAAIVLLIGLTLTAAVPTAAAGRPGSLFFASQDNTLAELVTLEEALVRAQARLEQVQSEIADQRSELIRMESSFAGAQEEAARLRMTIDARLVSLYKHSNPSLAEIIITSEDLDQVLELQEYSTRLASDDIRQIQAALSEMVRISTALNQLEAGRDRLAELERQAAAELERINRQVAQKKQLLATAPDAQSLQQQVGDVRQRLDQINAGGPAPSDVRPGRTMIMRATAYSPQEPGLNDHTATGIPARRGVAAVDPTVIPLGTRLLVEGYGEAIAGDTGSAIKGMRIDLCFDTLAECEAYGVRTVRVTVLE